MLRIAICDDEPGQRRLTRELVREFLRLRAGVEAQVRVFDSAQALLDWREQGPAFDLYLLDIIMPEVDGIQLGLKIRQRDEQALIIYLTTSPDFAVDSYLTRAFHYLLKPLERDKLFAVLDAAVQQLTGGREAAITLKTRQGDRRLPLGSIVYCDLLDGCVCYHMSDGESLCGVTLRSGFQTAVGELLGHEDFVRCGACCVVNLAYVASVKRDGVHLRDGGRLPLSRSLREQVTDRWMDLWLEEVAAQ